MKKKIYDIEERDVVSILEHWLACITQYYTEEMDFLLNDGQTFFVKYVPYDREFNTDTSTVAELAVANGVPQAQTIEEVYQLIGYKEVVFVSDIIGRFNITLKTASAAGDREKVVTQLNTLLGTLSGINQSLIAQGQQPKFKVAKLGEDILQQFPDVIKNAEEYIIEEAPQLPTAIPNEQPPAVGMPEESIIAQPPPEEMPLNNLNQP